MFETSGRIRCTNCGNWKQFEFKILHCGTQYKCQMCGRVWLENPFTSATIFQNGKELKCDKSLTEKHEWVSIESQVFSDNKIDNSITQDDYCLCWGKSKEELRVEFFGVQVMKVGR